jgi:hypothetical protein
MQKKQAFGSLGLGVLPVALEGAPAAGQDAARKRLDFDRELD